MSIHADSKRFYEQWTLSGEVYEPAAKLLLMAVKWLYTVPSFLQLKRTEQCSLLCGNWREIFILTAAQHSFYFDEGTFINFTHGYVAHWMKYCSRFFEHFNKRNFPWTNYLPKFISITDHITSVMSVKRPRIKEELRNFAMVLDKISRCRLDKAEYDYLKSTLLFRTGKYFNNTKNNNKDLS